MKRQFTCKTGNSNKHWSCDKDGTTAVFEWGRIGSNTSVTRKDFISDYDCNLFIEKKMNEKRRKGYTETTNKELNKEVKIAKDLGFRYKINKIEWCDQNGKIVDNYDPNGSIYLQIMESWKKKNYHIMLSRREYVESESVEIQGNKVTIGRPNYSPVFTHQRLRSVLDKLVQEVRKAIKSVKFAALGVRSVQLDDDPNDINFMLDEQESKQIFEAIGDSSASQQVISKFASLGSRTLDLF